MQIDRAKGENKMQDREAKEEHTGSRGKIKGAASAKGENKMHEG